MIGMSFQNILRRNTKRRVTISTNAIKLKMSLTKMITRILSSQTLMLPKSLTTLPKLANANRCINLKMPSHIKSSRLKLKILSNLQTDHRDPRKVFIQKSSDWGETLISYFLRSTVFIKTLPNSQHHKVQSSYQILQIKTPSLKKNLSSNLWSSKMIHII